MFIIPIPLASLLHDIVPRIDIVIFILVDQVIWCPGKLQHLLRTFPCFGFLQQPLDVQTDFCLRSFVCFIVNNQIPVHRKHADVLLELSARDLRATQILHRCKINKRRPSICQVFQFAIVLCIYTGICRCEPILFFNISFCQKHMIVLKDQIKIGTPSIDDRWPVCYNQHLLISHGFHKGIGCNGLAETHLTIPEHTIPIGKHTLGFVYASLLFLSEYDLGL